MVKTAKDYPVTFPYGATNPIGKWPDGRTKYQYYGPKSQTIDYIADKHRASDRSMKVGVKVVIGNTTIGLSGNTGASGGPHLHTQAGTDPAVQNTINPTPYEFKAGTVTAIRLTDTGDWGKYVTLKVGSKYITYAHLSSVNVKVGQVIKGEEKNMLTNEEIDVLYKFYLGMSTPSVQRKKYVGKVTFKEMQDFLLRSDSYMRRIELAKKGTLKPENHLPKALQTAYVEPTYEEVKETLYRRK